MCDINKFDGIVNDKPKMPKGWGKDMVINYWKNHGGNEADLNFDMDKPKPLLKNSMSDDKCEYHSDDDIPKESMKKSYKYPMPYKFEPRYDKSEYPKPLLKKFETEPISCNSKDYTTTNEKLICDLRKQLSIARNQEEKYHSDAIRYQDEAMRYKNKLDRIFSIIVDRHNEEKQILLKDISAIIMEKN
jgi:hypothetical protein